MLEEGYYQDALKIVKNVLYRRKTYGQTEE
jgi:hypothetical protein